MGMALLLTGFVHAPLGYYESRLGDAQIRASGRVATVGFYASLHDGRLSLLGVDRAWRDEPWEGDGHLVRFVGSLQPLESVVFRRWPMTMIDAEARTEVLSFATQEIEAIASPEGGGDDPEWPTDLRAQLEAMMPAALEAWGARKRRWVGLRNEERPDLDLAAVLPVHVGPATLSASGMRPAFSHDAPSAWTLWLMLVLRGVAYLLQPIGFVCLMVNLFGMHRHARWKKRGLCLSCGYDMRGLGVCPECGPGVASR